MTREVHSFNACVQALSTLRSGLARGSHTAAVAAVLALAGCGGGGGGGETINRQPSPVTVAVTDSYGTPVPGAVVTTPGGTTTTNDKGVALVPDTGGATTVTVTHETFVPVTVPVNPNPNEVTNVPVALERVTAAAGGSLASRSGTAPAVGSGGQQVTFEVEIVVVDGNSQPVPSLTAADFALQACTPNSATEPVDCIRGSSNSDDVAYTPLSPAPESVVQVAAGTARPFATGVLIDQSASILQSDRTGARLFAAKAFLGKLGSSDRAVLAALAGNPGATLPSTPLVVYGPYKEGAQGASYYSTIDTLAPLVGGTTPLYQALDLLREQWMGDSLVPAGLGKAVIVATDGDDSSCSGAAACRTRREQTIAGAKQAQVRIFPIALSAGSDVAALGELANGTGGALLYADTATQLIPLYSSVGRLMSLSLPTYRLRWTVRSDTANAFRPGHALVGKVRVTTGATALNVPFVVSLP